MTIGKRFQDDDLRDLCVESGVIAEGCDGRARIQSCCQASQDRVRGDDEASLEWISALDPCQPRSRGSSYRRSTQEHLHFPRRGVADLIHSAHG